MRNYGIVLLPDPATERYVRSLAKKTRRNKIRFGTKARVHLSLLHLTLRRRQLKRVKRAFRNLRLPQPVPVTAYAVLRQKSGWQFVEVRKTAALTRLQRAVLPLAKLRAADTPFSWREHASSSQKRSHTRYGYPNVGAGWQAHFTFARTDPKRGSKKAIAKKGLLTRIALVEIGENHGTAGKIICSRSL